MNWISVTERLPNPSYAVLVFAEGRVTYGYLRDPTYLGPRAAKWFVSGHPANSVTHWMPLPEPPEDL